MSKLLTLSGQYVEIQFPFDWEILDVVRNLPDRSFVKEQKLWRVPATAWHTAKAIAALKPLGFVISDDVAALEKQKQVTPRVLYDERLYPFQLLGVQRLAKSGGRAILGDDMGLGKTPQALVFAQHHAHKILVVSPANVLYKWLGEVDVWTKKSASIIKTGKSSLPNTDIHILSYGIMRTRHEELAEQMYDCVIFDEAHALKNPKAGQTRAARKMVTSGSIKKILFLSGTPFLNHPGELFPLLNMLNSLAFPNYSSYAKRYCGAQYMEGHWYFPKGVVTNVDELAGRLSSIMIRRTKREVLTELPDKTRTIVPVNFGLYEYRQAERDFKTWYKLHRSASYANVLTQMTAMRQVVGKGKVDAALELAKDILAQDEKVVLYAHHHEVVNMLKAGLYEYKVGVITGGVSAKERQGIVDCFQRGDCRVVIMSSAGAEGIDLYAASHIIFVEREWTPAKEEQAEDRLHRIGQKGAVNCWYLSATGTIDEKFARIVEGKRKIFGAVIGQDEILTTLLEET